MYRGELHLCLSHKNLNVTENLLLKTFQTILQLFINEAFATLLNKRALMNQRRKFDLSYFNKCPLQDTC